MGSALPDIIPADWSQWSETKPFIIEPLLGGLTNKSFLISANNTVLVLRINSPISAALDLNRVAETQALQLADSAGLCAGLVYCDPQYQYLVTRHIAGKQWSLNAEGLVQLAQLLRDIHQLPAITAELDISAKISSYWGSIGSHHDFVPALQSLNTKMQSHIDHAQALSNGRYLCHNDLLVDNLIAADSGKLYAIDWEYTAMADSFYELAVIVEGHRLDELQQQHLLSNYLGRAVSDKDWQRLFHWRLIYGYLALLWYVVQLSTGAMTQPGIQQYIQDQILYLSEQVA
ncbi:choline kinase family protein [Oceanicoccus sp. KOV_DT_Chl]|uniref:choline kinase family protein n=1 Tax=Oceanicoccus sp. KOV_DT_Chl TaxID=1904639 RepID=UPI000C7C8A81|nr:choline kinase family protein [Oceanicoccus sp. KOV_DT_Chl]